MADDLTPEAMGDWQGVVLRPGCSASWPWPDDGPVEWNSDPARRLVVPSSVTCCDFSVIPHVLIERPA